jgi:hypothetical protein
VCVRQSLSELTSLLLLINSNQSQIVVLPWEVVFSIAFYALTSLNRTFTIQSKLLEMAKRKIEIDDNLFADPISSIKFDYFIK